MFYVIGMSQSIAQSLLRSEPDDVLWVGWDPIAGVHRHGDWLTGLIRVALRR